MRKRKTVQKDQIKIALKDTEGNITRASELVGYKSPDVLSDRISRDNELKVFLKHIREDKKRKEVKKVYDRKFKRRGYVYSDFKVKHAIEKAEGYLSVAAKSLGCTVLALKKRIAKNNKLQELMNDFKEVRLDKVKKSILNMILNEDAQSVSLIKYYLRCQGEDDWDDRRKDRIDPTTSITINVHGGSKDSESKISINAHSIDEAQFEEVDDAEAIAEKELRKAEKLLTSI